MLLKLCHAVDVPVNCTITLKQPDKYEYYPGEKVEGTLTVSHQKDLVLLGFKVALEGTSLTKFKEGESVQNKADTFVNTFEYAYGGKVSGGVPQRYRLAGGKPPQKHPFSLTIPLEPLPANFKSAMGLIHYQIVVYMHVPPDRFVKKAEKGITITGLLPLNESTLSPISATAKGKTPLEVSLPQSGYLPGEEIQFQVELSNPNDLDITSMSVSLVQKINYKAGNLSRILKTTSGVVGSVEKKDNFGASWTSGLRIPSKQTPTQQRTIIEILYLVKVDVNTNGGPGNIRVEIPIVIGTQRGGSLEFRPRTLDIGPGPSPGLGKTPRASPRQSPGQSPRPNRAQAN